MQSLFITGTDTDVGKTHVGTLLMRSFLARNKTVIGYKPISAGCEVIDGELVNDDARQYHQLSNVKTRLQEVNPIAFEPAIAPHIAASEVERNLNLSELVAGYQHLCRYQPDVIITEGAGGWQLPLGNGEFLSALPKICSMQVVMVVGLRLGCLNHALLTAQAIIASGASFAGWIGNRLSNNMPYEKENIQTLTDELGAPFALVPYRAQVSQSQYNQAELIALTDRL